MRRRRITQFGSRVSHALARDDASVSNRAAAVPCALGRMRHLTRMPGCAPESGARRKMPGPSPDAASTIPSDKPNFILRGVRFATIGVRRPISSSGLYADLMPAKTVRVRPSPMSSVSLSSLSAPSTCSALTIRAMRRSTLEKSSILICGALAPDSFPPRPLAGEGEGVRGS